MSNRSTYWKGIALTFAGVLVLSSDALLIRSSGATGFIAAFWRALWAFLSLAVVLRITQGSVWKKNLASGGKKTLFSGFLWGASGVTFSVGVYNSGAAVALVAVGLAPFFAAMHSYIFYRTKSHPLTLFAAVGAIAGIGYMYSSHLESIGVNDLLYTVWAPLFYGCNLSFLRKHSTINRMSVSMIGGGIGAIIAFGLAKGAVGIRFDQLWPLIILGAVAIPFGQTAIGVGTKYIPAGESALISSLETIVGIFYVWLFLAEVPNKETLLGAAIVFGSIVANTVVQAYRVGERSVGMVEE